MSREWCFLAGLPSGRFDGLLVCSRRGRESVKCQVSRRQEVARALSEQTLPTNVNGIRTSALDIRSYSRSYAEDVTSVTSGASQGPHSFNLVFVCVFVCVTPGAIRI